MQPAPSFSESRLAPSMLWVAAAMSTAFAASGELSSPGSACRRQAAMTSPLRYLGQAVLYGLVAILFGYLSANPSYTHFPPDQAMVRLSFTHGADRRGECRQLSAE